MKSGSRICNISRMIIRRQPVFPVVGPQREPDAVIRTHSMPIAARLVHGIAIVSFGTRPGIAGRRIAITLAIVAHFQTSKPNSIGIVIKHNITLYLPSPQRRICAIIIAVTPLRLITALPMVLVPLMNVNKPRSGHTFIHFSILIFLSIVIHPL